MNTQDRQYSNDELLREGCIAGDRLAQKMLYQRYFGKLLGIPMRYTESSEEAKALLNQAFLKIFMSLESYNEQGSFIGWMTTITFRVTIDHFRSEMNYKKRISLNFKEPKAVTNSIVGQLEVEDIFRYIQQLPKELQMVFSMYVIDGYKHEEIADMLDITLSTSKWRLAKARKLLQKTMGQFYQRNDRLV